MEDRRQGCGKLHPFPRLEKRSFPTSSEPAVVPMQSGLATNTRRPAAAGKSRVGFLVNNLWHSPRGVSEVWQTQGLEIGVFGSVAVAGLMGEFSDVWQGKDLGDGERRYPALLLKRCDSKGVRRWGSAKRLWGKDYGKVGRII